MIKNYDKKVLIKYHDKKVLIKAGICPETVRTETSRQKSAASVLKMTEAALFYFMYPFFL